MSEAHNVRRPSVEKEPVHEEGPSTKAWMAQNKVPTMRRRKLLVVSK